MLPRFHGVEFDPENEETCLLIAGQFYPSYTHIDEIEDAKEKRGWIILCTQILQGQETAIRFAAETFSKVFQPGVEAQVADTTRKAAAEELEREEQKAREIQLFKGKLLLLAEQGASERKRSNLAGTESLTRLFLEVALKTQELDERRTKARHQSFREKLVIGMATIIFLAALAAFIKGWSSGEPWVIGTSGVTGVAALVAAVQLLSNENKSPPPSGGEAPPPST
jgi:hypothetical protein